jgi:mono/diheme cytochrome c family protein
MKKIILSLALFSLVYLLTTFHISCKKDDIGQNDTTTNTSQYDIEYLEASTQRSGDDQKGYDFLVNGDYNWSGIPYDMFTSFYGTSSANELNRSGDNAGVPYAYTVVTATNGVKVVVPNCMSCHASYLNGQFILGLGNSMADYTASTAAATAAMDFFVQYTYGANSPEWEAYEMFSKVSKAVSDDLVTECKGTNPADRLFTVLASHRDPNNLQWSDELLMAPPSIEVIPTDVPAWWILKKKHTMFYTALGQGDFARIMMASALLTLEDSSDARYTDGHFADVYAYLNTIEAPVYTQSIDQTLADQGKTIFESNCSVCHGSYGDNETYPNVLVTVNEVGTDSLLAYSYSQFPDYIDWFNNGWFGQEPYSASLVNTGGYVAPPLDGVWATAPYLHNGSVPTLEDLLNSSQRPVYWERTFNESDYDFSKIGWNYTVQTSAGSSAVYNTTLSGYGNAGHTFGDKLSGEERQGLIEYLKTL